MIGKYDKLSIYRKLIFFAIMATTLTFLLAVSACGSSSSTVSSTPNETAVTVPGAAGSTYPGGSTTAAGANSVSIKNFTFDQASITVPKGTTVTWTNDDSTAHTVTADDKSFDSGNLSNGKTFSYTFNTVGTFSYHCSIHTYMTAKIIVQ